MLCCMLCLQYKAKQHLKGRNQKSSSILDLEGGLDVLITIHTQSFSFHFPQIFSFPSYNTSELSVYSVTSHDCTRLRVSNH